MSLQEARDLILVQGLRPWRAQPHPWQQLILRRLSKRFGEIPPSESTREAEEGLDFPASAYWYVWRSDLAFGGMATIWKPGAEFATSPSGAGASPFDTGGLWHGHVITEPALGTDSEKRTFAAEQQCALPACAGVFQTWLEVGYGESPTAYVDGTVPSAHVPSVSLDLAKNTCRAWTWELRLASADIGADTIAPTEIFWRELDYEQFEAWAMKDSTLPPSERLQILKNARQMSRFSNLPTKDLKTRLYELIA
jgi:hypothetical protein